MNRCVVLGATGFLGTNLVHALFEADGQVRTFGLPGSDAEWIKPLGLEVAFGDVTNPGDVDAAVQVVDDAYQWYRKNGFL